ncbi:MAG: hypothetical protein SPK70_10745 [Succinivibrio dextrinosolvens]|nr:hypothetical protein [Succinivibrio dextrinosolvens]MDY6420984.1 hypothetical protein [Succinivibrio dextrinosolvens]MDY6471533.1 hypothetical protein [Succinivibrio dextrinosolvens]
MTLSLSIKVPDAQTDELVTKYSAIKNFSYKVERARAVAKEFFNVDSLELNSDKEKVQTDLQSAFNSQFALLESLLREKLIAKLEKELESPTSAVSRDETKEESVQAEDKAAKAETTEPAETAEEEAKTAPAENVNDDKVELVTDSPSPNNTNVEKLQQAKATSEEKSEEVAPSEKKESAEKNVEQTIKDWEASKKTKSSDKKDESAPIPERANLYAKNLLNIAEQRSVTLLRELSQNPRKFMCNSKLLGLNEQVFHDAACARYYQLMADPKCNPSVTDRQIMSWAVGPLGYNGCAPLLSPVVQKLSNNYAVEAFRDALIAFDKCRQSMTDEKYQDIRKAVKKYGDKITSQDGIIILSFINEEMAKRFPDMTKTKNSEEKSSAQQNSKNSTTEVKPVTEVAETTAAEDEDYNPEDLPF